MEFVECCELCFYFALDISGPQSRSIGQPMRKPTGRAVARGSGDMVIGLVTALYHSRTAIVREGYSEQHTALETDSGRQAGRH